MCKEPENNEVEFEYMGFKYTFTPVCEGGGTRRPEWEESTEESTFVIKEKTDE